MDKAYGPTIPHVSIRSFVFGYVTNLHGFLYSTSVSVRRHIFVDDKSQSCNACNSAQMGGVKVIETVLHVLETCLTNVDIKIGTSVQTAQRFVDVSPLTMGYTLESLDIAEEQINVPEGTGNGYQRQCLHGLLHVLRCYMKTYVFDMRKMNHTCVRT